MFLRNADTVYRNTSLRRINTAHTATRKGPRQTDYTSIIIYSPLKRTLFYPYHFILLPYVILQIILYLCFILYVIF
jgi:hypothetical protein